MEKSHSFQIFEEAINSEKTRKLYVSSLENFRKFSGISNYDDFIKKTPDQIHDLISSWILHLKKRGLKGVTIRSRVQGVELFFEMNRFQIYKRILHKLYPKDEEVPGGNVPFTTEEIQRMLNSTTKLRTKALILFLTSTGTRPGAIVDPILRIKHLQKMPNNCKAILLYEGFKEEYWAFLTPESSKAMTEYLDSRKLNGEQLTEESPLFSTFRKMRNAKQDNLSTISVRQILVKVLKAAGIKRTKKGHNYDKAIVYGFRKRFNTILKLNNEINSNIAEKLMAHKNGLDANYLKPTRDECFSEFFKGIPDLTISDEARDKAKITKLEGDRTEIENLKSTVELLMNDSIQLLDKRVALFAKTLSK